MCHESLWNNCYGKVTIAEVIYQTSTMTCVWKPIPWKEPNSTLFVARIPLSFRWVKFFRITWIKWLNIYSWLAKCRLIFLLTKKGKKRHSWLGTRLFGRNPWWSHACSFQDMWKWKSATQACKQVEKLATPLATETSCHRNTTCKTVYATSRELNNDLVKIY